MCPRQVCTTCGEPRRRIVERDPDAVAANLVTRGHRKRDGRGDESGVGHYGGFTLTSTETLGWTDCGHDNNYRRGHILDPFGGSGTTAVVATHHGRDCTLIDIDERNADLARERVGMFLEVAEPEEAA